MTSKPRTTTNGEPPINGDGSENGDLFGGPTASSCREQALTRVAEIENLTAGFQDPARLRAALGARIGRPLQPARPGPARTRAGPPTERCPSASAGRG